ncbi:hypothetical protein FRB97_000583 [Tulasnella sp. 331]|nr:hypothetical protein FRB97_000583 [Tulasnella sp. 331]
MQHLIPDTELERLRAAILALANTPYGRLQETAALSQPYIGNITLLPIHSVAQMLAARAYTAEKALLASRLKPGEPSEDPEPGHSESMILVQRVEAFGNQKRAKRALGKDEVPKASTSSALEIDQGDTVSTVTEKLVDHYKIPAPQIRLWVMARRLNQTIRPETMLRGTDATKTIEAIRKQMTKDQSPELCLYLELLPPRPEIRTPIADAEQILLFFKYFNIAKQTISGAFKVSISKKTLVSRLRTVACERMRWPLQTPVMLYEEVKPGQIDTMPSSATNARTLEERSLKTGDIICFYASKTPEECTALAEQGLCANAIQWYKLIQHKVAIHFEPLASVDHTQGSFELNLRMDMSLDELNIALAKRLYHDATKIRLYSADALGYPNEWDPFQTMQSLVQPLCDMPQPALVFYELLDVDIADL